MRVEVKAPVSLSDDRTVRLDGYPELLAKRLRRASTQFPRQGLNLFACVPMFSFPVWGLRAELVSSFYAHEALQMEYDNATGQMVGRPRPVIIQDGLFLRWRSTEGRPGFTRVSGVMTLEPYPIDRQTRIQPRSSVGHHVLVLHNPNAKQALPIGGLGADAEFALVGDEMRWSDGAKAFS